MSANRKAAVQIQPGNSRLVPETDTRSMEVRGDLRPTTVVNAGYKATLFNGWFYAFVSCNNLITHAY